MSCELWAMSRELWAMSRELRVVNYRLLALSPAPFAFVTRSIRRRLAQGRVGRRCPSGLSERGLSLQIYDYILCCTIYLHFF